MRVVKILIVLGAVLLLAGVIGVALWFHRDMQTRSVTLPNSSIITVEAILLGTNQFTTSTPFYNAARKYLPRGWQGWIPPQISGRMSADTNSITLYIRQQNTPLNFSGQLWDTSEVYDTAGLRYERISGSGSIGGYQCLMICSFPRRDPEFIVHLLNRSNSRIATLRLPNPVKGPFPVWKSETLPQSKTNGLVQLTLNGGSVSKSDRHIHCKWRTELKSEDNLWSKHGKIRYHWLTDATGNYGSFLSPKEPAWKVHFQCFRNEKTSFRTNETWLLKDLKVPTAGDGRALLLTNTIEGVRIAVQTLSGAALTVITNGTNFSFRPYANSSSDTSSSSSSGFDSWEELGSDCPMFVIETDHISSDTEILFRFRDAAGKLIPPEATPYGYNSSSTGSKAKRKYMKRIKVNSDTVSLEVIINRGRQFEFLISPLDVEGTDQYLRTVE